MGVLEGDNIGKCYFVLLVLGPPANNNWLPFLDDERDSVLVSSPGWGAVAAAVYDRDHYGLRAKGRTRKWEVHARWCFRWSQQVH